MNKNKISNFKKEIKNKELHLDYNSNSILRDVRSYAANQASIDHYVHHKTLEYVSLSEMLSTQV